MKIAADRIDWGRTAQWFALFALMLQALVAVPLSARMMLEGAAGETAVICTAFGSKTITLTKDGSAPVSDHPHCAICLVAALSVLEGIAFALIVAMRRQSVARIRAWAFALAARRSPGSFGRAPALSLRPFCL